MKIAVIGAGNGGQAISAFLTLSGAEVRLYDYMPEKIIEMNSNDNIIELCGKIEGKAKISLISNDISEVVNNSDIIMVTTTANAHSIIAKQIAPLITDDRIIILNPGRTGGALEFKQTLLSNGCNKRIYIAEAQTLVYACRLINNGKVNVIGIKDKVLLSALPSSDTDYILSAIQKYYPCFKPAINVLHTSLENIGAIFHPCVLLFNAATIERQSEFWFYKDMTPKIADFIESFDKERLAVGKAFGISLLSVNEWISFAYPETYGNTLCEKMINNPAYHNIKSPSTIFTRQLTEDIPTGVLPIMELGKAAGVNVPLMEGMVNICSSLLGMDFSNGRTLKNLGLSGKNKEEILKYLS